MSTSGKYAIVGVGETAYRRFAPDPSPTTLELATEAVNAALDDAGLAPSEVDGMMSYSVGDSVESSIVAGNLGITLDNFTDISGGGSSIETLIMLAIGTIEAGAAHTICLFRSMLGYSGNRIGLAKVGGPQIGNGLTRSHTDWSAPRSGSPRSSRAT